MTINIYFQAKTPLDKEIRITNEYWKFIVTVKHVNMYGKEKEVIKTLEHPDFIRKSNKDTYTIEALTKCISALPANI